MTPLALFVEYVRQNPGIPADDPRLERIWRAYLISARTKHAVGLTTTLGGDTR